MDDSVFAIELKPNGRVMRLAHTHSLVDESQEHDYWAEPQASVNPDFTRILFTTNWGRSGTGEVEMFMIELPPSSTPSPSPSPTASATSSPTPTGAAGQAITVAAGVYHFYAGMDANDSGGPPDPAVDPMGSTPTTR